MKLDFYQLQKDMMQFISVQYKPIAKDLYGLEPLEKAIMSFPDIDRERKSKVLYFDFDKYSFETLTLESYLFTGFLNLYITLRGTALAQTMTEQIAKYATCFFKLINKDDTLNNLVDICVIEEIEFFENAEGNENYKAALIKIKFKKEYN